MSECIARDKSKELLYPLFEMNYFKGKIERFFEW